MTTPLAHADIYTDFQGLSELRGRARDKSPEALREVAGQFEALLLQMMMKSMRDANLGEGLMDSDHVKTYQSMFDQQMAIDLGKSGRLGLAEMMVRQLSRSGDFADQASATTAPEPLAAPVSLPSQAAIEVRKAEPEVALADALETSAGAAIDDWEPESPEAFVKALWPHAQRAAEALGTRPEVLIAQAALETGWGRHMIRGGDGQNSFNLFGIKADARWNGARAVTETVEFRDGVMRKERATFRAYDSLAASFDDYVQFLKTNPRYRDALDRAADAPAYTRALAEAGYATDPDYAGKIGRIMDSPTLRDALSGIDTVGRGRITG